MWFEFRLTGHGWAEAGIGDATSSAALTASYISDALSDLLYAVWRVLEGNADSRCSWLEEPGEFRWILSRTEDRVSLRILQFDDWSPQRADELGTVVFETTQDVLALARAIALGGSRTLEAYGDRGYEEKWGSSFPRPLLDRVQLILRRERSG